MRIKEDTRLHFSVWDWDRFTEDDFLGYADLRVDKLPFATTVTRNLALRPMPEGFKDNAAATGAAGDNKLQRTKSKSSMANPDMGQKFARDIYAFSKCARHYCRW